MSVALPELVAAIYTGAFEFSFDRFKQHALELVRASIPFDSAVWGSGIRSSNTMLTVATVDFPAGNLIEYATHWQDQDFVRAAALARPGIAVRIEDAMPLAEYRRTDVYTVYSRPRGIEYSLATAFLEPTVDVVELICLFRANPEAAFSDSDCDLMQKLMPHLGRSWQHRQIIHGLDSGLDPTAQAQDRRGHAVVDDFGLVHAANLQFAAALRGRDPDWTGPRLPADLAQFIAGDRPQAELGNLRASATRGAGRHLLTIVISEAPLLSIAETRVADLYARGLSTSAIAQTLNVSRSTVRNQVSSIFRKLEIHSKAELARLIPDRR